MAAVLGAPLLFVLLLPSLLAAALARWAAARLLGMRGVRFLFGGSIENAQAAAPWRRAAVAGAALAASYLVAGVFFTAGALTGAYSVRTTQVEVAPGKPAAEAGMETGDRIVSIGGEPTATWEDIADGIARRPGEPVEIVVSRGGEEKRLTVTPQRTKGNKGRIGIQGVLNRDPPGLLTALRLGLTRPMTVLVDIVRGLLSALGEQEVELAGPVAVVREVAKTSRSTGDTLWMIGAFLAYVWPLSALVALASIPRRAKAPAKR